MIELSAAQHRFIESRLPFVCLSGGWGSGKTHAGAWRLISRMVEKPGKEHAFYAPTTALLKGRPLAALREVLDSIGIRYRKREPSGLLQLDCGKYGVIHLRSFHRPESIRSYEAVHQHVDELDALSHSAGLEVWNQIIGRSRGAEGASISVGSTPDQGINGMMHHLFGETKDGHELIFAPTKDNIWLPDLEGYISRVRSQLPPNLAEMYLEGRFVALGQGRVYYAYKEACYRQANVEEIQTYHIGQDFNVDGCASTVSVRTTHGGLHVFDEFLSANTHELTHNIAMRYPGKRIIVYPDASGKNRTTNASESDIAIIEGAGFLVDAADANPRIMDRIHSVNGAFAHGRLSIDPRTCPETHKALTNQVFKDGEPEKFPGPGTVDDWNDSLGYKVCRLMPHKKVEWASGVRMMQ